MRPDLAILLHLAFWIAIFGVTLSIGLGIGFNVATYLRDNEVQDRTIPGVVVAALSLIGAGISAGGMFRIWNKERKDEQKIPVLEFDGFIIRDHYTIEHGKRAGWIAKVYLVRIKKTKGFGKAEACEGWIKLEAGNFNIPCKWSPDPSKLCDLGGSMELTLFYAIPRVGGIEELIFAAIDSENKVTFIELPYDGFLQSQIINIAVHSRNAKTPSPINKTVKEVIDEATASL